MQLKTGCTRIVVVLSTIAIKIALPFRPFVPFYAYIRAYFDGTLAERMRRTRGCRIERALHMMTVGGIEANRREIRIYRQHPDYPIAPVIGSYLGGFIIVMPRGEPASTREVDAWIPSAPLPPHLQNSDLFDLCNVYKFGEVIRLIDYGHPQAEEILPLLFANRL